MQIKLYQIMFKGAMHIFTFLNIIEYCDRLSEVRRMGIMSNG